MSYLDDIAEKRTGNRLVAQEVADKKQVSDLLQQIKDAVTNQKSDTVIDITEQVKHLGRELTNVIKQLDSNEINKQQLTILNQLQAVLSNFKPVDNTSDYQQILEAIKQLQMSTVIKVPNQKFDLSPLQNTIKEHFPIPKTEKINLECYRAQDINNNDPEIQYVGFVNPDGNWYIIENNIAGNSLRYIFGNSGYKKAFDKAATYRYSVLNEAIDALTA